MLDSFSALIDRFGIGPFSEAIGVSYGAAKQMRRRDSISPEHWPPVIAASHAKGWDDVSADRLMKLAASRAERSDAADVPVRASAA